MSRTTRRHEARSRAARRGPKNPEPEGTDEKFKPTKQRRVNERARLRKEWRG